VGSERPKATEKKSKAPAFRDAGPRASGRGENPPPDAKVQGRGKGGGDERKKKEKRISGRKEESKRKQKSLVKIWVGLGVSRKTICTEAERKEYVKYLLSCKRVLKVRRRKKK